MSRRHRYQLLFHAQARKRARQWNSEHPGTDRPMVAIYVYPKRFGGITTCAQKFPRVTMPPIYLERTAREAGIS